MRFESDPEKARTNPAKHGIRFSIAELIFFDPLRITTPDNGDHGHEERWNSIGTLPTASCSSSSIPRDRSRWHTALPHHLRASSDTN